MIGGTSLAPLNDCALAVMFAGVTGAPTEPPPAGCFGRISEDAFTIQQVQDMIAMDRAQRTQEAPASRVVPAGELRCIAGDAIAVLEMLDFADMSAGQEDAIREAIARLQKRLAAAPTAPAPSLDGGAA